VNKTDIASEKQVGYFNASLLCFDLRSS